MARIDFIGGSYTAQSIIADNQRCGNMYVEADGSGAGKSSKALYGRPGLKRFAQLPDLGIRGMLYHKATGRAFAVCGSGFFEIFADGSSVKRAALANDGLPASLAESNIQIMIASDQVGYCFTLATNGFAAPANLVSPLQVQYADGFFVAIQANSNKFQYSNALDGLTWQALNTSAISVWPDNVQGFNFDHRELIIFGNTKSVAYYDSGNTFTFDVASGGYIDDGLAATFARNRLDNTTFYLAQDDRGSIVAKRLNGYTPVRISTHAIETAWRGYSKVSDAVSWPFGFNGHLFWVVNFPSANAGRGSSWVYDVATQLWAEWFYLNPGNGKEYAMKAQNHMHAFGKHLVGDPNSGNIYELNDTFYDDDGDAIRRVRRLPHIANEGERITGHLLRLDMETGLATFNNPDGTQRGPQCMLRLSRDGGKTYGMERWRDCGQLGNYLTRVEWRQLGQWRDAVFEWSATDAVPWRIIDAYLDASGYGRVPTQRLSEKLRQQA